MRKANEDRETVRGSEGGREKKGIEQGSRGVGSWIVYVVSEPLRGERVGGR